MVCVRAASDEEVEFAARYFTSVWPNCNQCRTFFLRVETQIIQFRTEPEFINSFASEARNRPSYKTVNLAVSTY